MKRNAKRAGIQKRVLLIGIGLFNLTLRPVAAAEITLPDVEMTSRASTEEGKFVLGTAISADLALYGGYKYAFLLGFSLDTTDITDFKQMVPNFRIAQASARDIFGLPVELSYFFGSYDDFCNGDDFVSQFGLSPFGTEFLDFYYFPLGIRYKGIYGVRGTGLALGLNKWENIYLIMYLYRELSFLGAAFGGIGESYYSDAVYSGDLRLLFNHGWLRLETFAGFSLNTDLKTRIRGGLMVYLAGNGVEFFAQAGIPGWTIKENFKIDNLYFLLEPRLRLGIFGINVTFFYHPWEYMHILTDKERGKADINVKFLFGNPNTGLAGGIEAGGEVKLDGFEDFVLRISPFGSLVSGGLRWDAKLRIRPLKAPKEMFEILFGVRTAF